jgi:hypothetical protein
MIRGQIVSTCDALKDAAAVPHHQELHLAAGSPVHEPTADLYRAAHAWSGLGDPNPRNDNRFWRTTHVNPETDPRADRDQPGGRAVFRSVPDGKVCGSGQG